MWCTKILSIFLLPLPALLCFVMLTYVVNADLLIAVTLLFIF